MGTWRGRTRRSIGSCGCCCGACGWCRGEPRARSMATVALGRRSGSLPRRAHQVTNPPARARRAREPATTSPTRFNGDAGTRRGGGPRDAAAVQHRARPRILCTVIVPSARKYRSRLPGRRPAGPGGGLLNCRAAYLRAARTRRAKLFSVTSTSASGARRLRARAPRGRGWTVPALRGRGPRCLGSSLNMAIRQFDATEKCPSRRGKSRAMSVSRSSSPASCGLGGGDARHRAGRRRVRTCVAVVAAEEVGQGEAAESSGWAA